MAHGKRQATTAFSQSRSSSDDAGPSRRTKRRKPNTAKAGNARGRHEAAQTGTQIEGSDRTESADDAQEAANRRLADQLVAGNAPSSSPEELAQAREGPTTAEADTCHHPARGLNLGDLAQEHREAHSRTHEGSSSLSPLSSPSHSPTPPHSPSLPAPTAHSSTLSSPSRTGTPTASNPSEEEEEEDEDEDEEDDVYPPSRASSPASSSSEGLLSAPGNSDAESRASSYHRLGSPNHVLTPIWDEFQTPPFRDDRLYCPSCVKDLTCKSWDYRVVHARRCGVEVGSLMWLPWIEGRRRQETDRW